MPAPIELRERLVSSVSPDGGWGYVSGQAAHIEPTCLALLALSTDAERHATPISNALQFLATHAKPDGTYRLQRGRPQATWATALVALSRHSLGQSRQELEPIAKGLLSIQARIAKRDPEIADMMDIDVNLKGWPWAEGTFSWVEPTAWACLALRTLGHANHPRVREGLQVLLDRAFDSGGVNYGNRMVLGKSTEPIPGPTAAMLLALQGVPDQPRIDAAIGYLRVHGEQSTDLEHLSWIRLALTVHANDAATRAVLPVLDARIQESLAVELSDRNGLTVGPLRLALAALALDADRHHPFRVTDTPELATTSSVNCSEPSENGDTIPSEKRSVGEWIKSKFRSVLVAGLGKLRPLPEFAGVHIARAENYELPLADILKTQYDHFRQAVPVAGKRVVLKPNLVEYHRDKVINTDPRFIDAVIQLLKAEGAAEIIVAEGPGHWRNVPYLVRESGLGDVLRKHDVRFVDVNHDEPVKVMNLGGATGLEFLYLSRTIFSAEVLISLPKLKTHHWAGATLSLKNLFGTLPGICYGWPKNELHWRGIPNSIIDIAATHTPQLAIVDGIIGMEGDGPLNGTAKHAGVLVMGADLVAVDATCCRIMGLPPERVPTLVLGEMKRVGRLREAEIPQLGVPIAEVAQQFELPPTAEKILITEGVPS